MSTSSGGKGGLSDVKQILRKVDYPQCAEKALVKIAVLICNGIPSIKHMDLALDLMTEFVFYELDRHGNKRPLALSALLELQLLDILFEYFHNFTFLQSTRNTVFLSLFSGSTTGLRSGILGKLVSLAVGIPSSGILIAASTWMQQLGNVSMHSCKLAETLVFDYFSLAGNTEERLNKLPTVCAPFTANFLAAISENYFVDPAKFNQQVYPNNLLLKTITLWINENPNLCVAAQQTQAALPPGAIAMESTTSIAGLLKWCVLAPILGQDSFTYAQLHLALLNTIVEIPVESPARAIGAHQLCQIVPNVLFYVRQHKVNGGNEGKDLQLALDRFAQAIQIALSVKAVYGNLDELFNQLKTLPKNKLMNIIFYTHKSI